MEFKHDNEYQIYGKYETQNNSDSIINLVFKLEDDTTCNIKTKEDIKFELNKVYYLRVACKFNGTRNYLILLDYKDIVECDLTDHTIAVMKHFYPVVEMGIQKLEQELDYYLDMIDNIVIKDITVNVMNHFRHDFLIYPAAVKMHHTYIGGLAYHSLTIVKLALNYLDLYSCLDKDYLIAGAILHDVAKVIEFKSPTDDIYSTRGQLIGHLVLGAMEVEKEAYRLGYQDKEEVTLLEHIIISHHGQLQFGACKRPVTPEAILLAQLDATDSKLRVVDETFMKMQPGTWSENIGVLERLKCYKKMD